MMESVSSVLHDIARWYVVSVVRSRQRCGGTHPIPMRSNTRLRYASVSRNERFRDSSDGSDGNSDTGACCHIKLQIVTYVALPVLVVYD